MEDFFHSSLNQKRNAEMAALKNMHKLQNIQNLVFELTFMSGAFLNVYLYVSKQDGGTLDTATAFSQIALVNGLRGNFTEMMQ
jgi:hypothetical protein